MSTKAIKWSSVLLIISGVLLAAPILFHPDMSKPGYALLGAWVPVHVLLGISALAGLAGLIVFYGAMSPKITVFGHVAVWFAIVGTALLAGLMFFVESAIVPVLAGDPTYEPLLGMTGPLMTGAFGALAMLSMVIVSIGFILFGGYLIWAKVISPVNGALFIIGAPLAAFSPPFPYIVGIIGGVLLGIAIGWLGVSIRTGRAHDTLETTLRIHDECLAQAGGRP
ncbi:MAG: hypothetical protein ACM3MD_05330 [Betaproteobacteria bacterium]